MSYDSAGRYIRGNPDLARALRAHPVRDGGRNLLTKAAARSRCPCGCHDEDELHYLTMSSNPAMREWARRKVAG